MLGLLIQLGLILNDPWSNESSQHSESRSRSIQGCDRFGYFPLHRYAWDPIAVTKASLSNAALTDGIGLFGIVDG